MEMTEGDVNAIEEALYASEGDVANNVIDTAPSSVTSTAADGTVANIRDMIDQSVDSNVVTIVTPARGEYGSQDDLDSPHLESLKSALSSFNAQRLDDMAKKSMWTRDTLIDSEQFRNPLHYLVEAYAIACETQVVSNQSFSECLSVLTSHGVDLNEGDSKRNTPLHLLCQHCGVDDVIKILLASGAKVNFENIHQQTPLHLATDNGTTKDVETLLEGGADPNHLDCTGMGSLHNAVKYRRNGDTIKYLIACGASVDLQLVEGHRIIGSAPLHIAVRQDRRENVKLLLELGAQTEVKDSSGQTPLHLAAKYDITGHMTRYLLQGGAYIDSCDILHQETPLHKSIKRNMVENVRTIIEMGASLSKPDLNGDSPLHCAAICCRNIEIWVMLMNAPRVDIQLRNAKGKTVLEQASRMSNKLAVNILKQIEG